VNSEIVAIEHIIMWEKFYKMLTNVALLRVLTKKGLKPYMNLQNKETQKNLNSNILFTH